jgi:HK97 family phage prohead protease
MATLNSAGVTYARSLIAAGKVNKSAAWSFSAADGNALLGKNEDWSSYGKAHLGVDAKADAKSKDHWKYPFAKGGMLYRSALTAIRQRAGQQNDTDVFAAAGALLNAVDKPKSGEGVPERKALSFELKADAQGDGTFTGYGAVIGNVDQGGDIIRSGAFTDTLSAYKSKGKMPRMLWQHDTGKPIGVWSEMKEDSHGLYVEGKLTKGVQQADEAYALLKDGAIDGLSIGYSTVDAEYDADLGVRSLKKLNLYEVSLVTVPMNDAANVTSVKAADEIKTIRQFQAALRDVLGYSRAKAEAIAECGFKSIDGVEDDEAREVLSSLKSLEDMIRKASK